MNSSESTERPRWLLERRPSGWFVVDGHGKTVYAESVVVMPVAEHEALREAAQAVVEAYGANSVSPGFPGFDARMRDLRAVLSSGRVPVRVSDENTRRTPDEWLAIKHPRLRVLDPDGWRGPRGRPWSDRISEEEFDSRLPRCTISGEFDTSGGQQ